MPNGTIAEQLKTAACKYYFARIFEKRKTKIFFDRGAATAIEIL